MRFLTAVVLAATVSVGVCGAQRAAQATPLGWWVTTDFTPECDVSKDDPSFLTIQHYSPNDPILAGFEYGVIPPTVTHGDNGAIQIDFSGNSIDTTTVQANEYVNPIATRTPTSVHFFNSEAACTAYLAAHS